MPLFKQESLELLKQRIDLVEVVSSHVDLKKVGATYKGLCPFHDEKSPSFIVDKSDHHYHCYGCGAHGDAIKFLMEFSKMSFIDSIESLAARFGVFLETEEQANIPKGPPKSKMKELTAFASRFYHMMLLHTDEGNEALRYLYARGLDLDFIRRFEIGLAPADGQMLLKLCEAKKWGFDLLEAVGLGVLRRGYRRSFFDERITFPIRDSMGGIIGFSARKYQEKTFGGKYVNTPETPLFKKSRVLFGIYESRRRIAKEGQVIIVEGQIDALRLIEEGFDFTVAGQGTAFGEGHTRELINLGVKKVFLAMDGDEAGREASAKIGNLFQREGIEVRVVAMELGSDPDTLLREVGAEAFMKRLEESGDYLTFLVEHYSRYIDIHTPAGKNQLVTKVSSQIREWNEPVMVHESLRKLAHLAQVPEGVVGVGEQHLNNITIQKSGSSKALGGISVNADRILEMELLRWIIFLAENDPQLLTWIRNQISVEDLHDELCKETYQTLLGCVDNGDAMDPMTLAMTNEKIQGAVDELSRRKVHVEKSDELVPVTIQRILDRNWLQKREEVRILMLSSKGCIDKEMELMREFNSLGNTPPKVEPIPPIPVSL